VSDAKVALVTGASRGIGAAIARRLSEDHFVVGTATTADGAAVIDAALSGSGRGLEMRVDDDQSVDEALGALGADEQLPAILVNNAGVTADNLLMRMKSEEWNSVIETNLGGLFRVVKPCLRSMMRARWGRIVNISSVVARMGNPGQGNYVTSKAGIEGFTRSLALEVASRGITVNAVAPGFIATDMTSELTEGQVAQMLERVPVGTMGAPEDVAEAVAFLVSDGAGYITGETLSVNGGLHMH
tara:strand:- start:591 stop:1319 length:729 start_codon:yes stop_codon:yes gene_type:complete